MNILAASKQKDLREKDKNERAFGIIIITHDEASLLFLPK
jgi:hypothetical protein